jgi:hypothetical protein
MYVLSESHRVIADNIPDKIRKSLDSVGILARCLEYERFVAMGVEMQDPTAYHGYFDKAINILKARSAFQLASEMASLRKTADSMSSTIERAPYLERLSRIERENPQPSRESIRKAMEMVGTAANRNSARIIRGADGLLHKSAGAR